MSGTSINTNQELAVLSKLNQLIERWGLTIDEVRASISYPNDGCLPDELRLEFERGPLNERRDIFLQMLAKLEVPAENWVIEGGVAHALQLLDKALALTPRAHVRGGGPNR